jgi:TonB-linked SusC/RagA family outer membrane protein
MKKREKIVSCRKSLLYYVLFCIVAFAGYVNAEPDVRPTGAATAVGQQTTPVRGTVTDEIGEPVAGAAVAIKGTAKGTVTDKDGQFSIDVRRGETLVISYIGYHAQEVRYTGQAGIAVSLRENTQNLDEVVVIGYGAQKKASLVGSVASVAGAQLEAIPTSNLTNALAGRLAGVTVAQNQGGRPGNSSAITIRARGTWNSTAPLYVIDGVVRDSRAFDVLDASEVESISVLKDASAGSIYGARAANGVVLVQTKRGKEGKPVVSYSGSASVSNFAYAPKVETAMQHIAFTNDYEREYNVNPNTDNNIPYSEKWGFHYWPNTYKNGTDASGGYINSAVFTDDEIDYYRTHGGYNLLDEALRTPVANSHAVNVSGGNERLTYFAGATYYDQTGVFKVYSYNKYAVRGGLDAVILPGLKLSATVNTDHSTDNAPSGGHWATSDEGDDNRRKGGALFYSLLRSSRLFPGKVDGKYIGTGANMTGGTSLAIAEGAAGTMYDKYWNIEYTAALQYDVPWVKGLSAKVLYNNYTRHSDSKEYNTPYLVYQTRKEGTNNHIVTEDILSSVQVGGKPSLSESHSRDLSYQLNGFINYNNTFGRHEVGAMLGFEQAESENEKFNAEITNYDLEGHPYFVFGPSDKNYYGIGGSGSEDGRLSYLGRLNYAFDSRYLVEFTFRHDASVKFAAKNRWGFFPSGAVAWRIAEERFIKDNFSRVINNLKLRASLGLTGNDAVGAWQYMDRATITQGTGDGQVGGAYYGGSSRTYGAGISSVANSAITWEKSRNYNVGLDAGVLNNLFTLGFDYFFRHTYDILGSQTAEIPDTFGASLADSNYGIVDSWGYELELGFNKQLSRNVAVWAKANFGFSDNKLVEWAETGVPPHLSRIGKNWDRQAGFLTDGVIQTAVNNGDGTYTINGKYVVPETGYLYRGSNYNITSSNKYAMRPGSVFIVDIGSSYIDEATGEKVYTSEPDGKITDDDADKTWIIDRYNPPYNYSLLLGGSWKGLSLEVFMQGLGGHQTLISTANSASYYWYEGNWAYWSEDHFSFEGNPDGQMPAPTNGGGHNSGAVYQNKSTTNNSIWVRDASFLRLKNVTLSYDFNKRLLSKANISLARIYVAGNNLALLYNPLKVFDPELAGTSNDPNPGGSRPGNGIYATPLSRTFTVGVNFNF